MRGVEAWLYGSVARGTDDAASDLDVLVIGDDDGGGAAILGAATLSRSEHLSLRRYSWPQVEAMAAYGSLFLLHLRLEGRLLGFTGDSPALSELLDRLPAYQLADRDIVGFLLALDDVEWSLRDDGDAGFELGVLATVLRHCSILACYQIGQPLFDRCDSIATAFKAVGMGEHASRAIAMYDFRLASARDVRPRIQPRAELAMSGLRLAREFVRRVRELQ